MNRGRRPTPTALKIVKGNPGKRPLPRDEPQPSPDTLARPPRHLDRVAAAEWRRLSREFAALEMLTALDRGSLELLVTAWSRWRRAEGKVAELGEVIATTNGILVTNPWLTISNRAHEQYRKLAPEFGMTPAARPRLGQPLGGAKPRSDEFDEFAYFDAPGRRR
jgi:P27 family predicted phage terminase small subunit